MAATANSRLPSGPRLLSLSKTDSPSRTFLTGDSSSQNKRASAKVGRSVADRPEQQAGLHCRSIKQRSDATLTESFGVHRFTLPNQVFCSTAAPQPAKI